MRASEFNLFLSFQTQRAKKTCLRFTIVSYREMLQRHGVIVQKSLSEKTIYRNKKIPFLQCPPQVKKQR